MLKQASRISFGSLRIVLPVLESTNWKLGPLEEHTGFPMLECLHSVEHTAVITANVGRHERNCEHEVQPHQMRHIPPRLFGAQVLDPELATLVTLAILVVRHDGLRSRHEVDDRVEDECVGCEGESTREVSTFYLMFPETGPELGYIYSLKAHWLDSRPSSQTRLAPRMHAQ